MTLAEHFFGIPGKKCFFAYCLHKTVAVTLSMFNSRQACSLTLAEARYRNAMIFYQMPKKCSNTPKVGCFKTVLVRDECISSSLLARFSLPIKHVGSDPQLVY